MSGGPNYCSNCGEKLDTDKPIADCPKCHSDLHEHSKHIESTPRIVEQLPYKSPGTTALIAFLGGLFALPGIGHMYVGKLRRGIIILIGGFVLYVIFIVAFIALAIPFQYNDQIGRTEPMSSSVFIYALIPGIIFSVAYLAFFIWQIFDARKYAKKFNERVKATGKEPW